MRTTSKAANRNGLTNSGTLRKTSTARTPATPLSARRKSSALRTGEINRSKQTIDFTFKSVKARPLRANVHKPKKINFIEMIDKSVDTNDLEWAGAACVAFKPEDYLLSECDFDYPTKFSYNSSDVLAIMELMENEEHERMLCVETIDDVDDAPSASYKPAIVYSVMLNTAKHGYEHFQKLNALLAPKID